MSDRVILMRRGRIVQEGPPRKLFDRPVSRFVADFMGVENILEEAPCGRWMASATVRVRNEQVTGTWCGGSSGSRHAGLGRRARRADPFGAASPGAGGRPATSSPGRPGTTIYKGKYLDQSFETEVGTIKARIWDSQHRPVADLEPVVGRRLHGDAACGTRPGGNSRRS